MGTLVTFTLCMITSEITKIINAETKIDSVILAEIKRGELTKGSSRYRCSNFMNM